MKQKLVATVLGFLIVSSALAVNKDDITMVSYEQGWLDYRGTLAIKNNTDKDIHNVVFLITYLDMSGNQLDYEEFTKEVSIAPGMTKKIDIAAYEHGRGYHYYKSENKPGGSPAFKIEFELKDYNVEESVIGNNDDYTYKSDGNYYAIIVIIALLVVISVIVGLYVLVAVMAKRRNRNIAIWVLLSILASPLLIIIILLIVGNDDSQIEEI